MEEEVGDRRWWMENGGLIEVSAEGVPTFYMLSKTFNEDTRNEAQEMNFR